MARLPTIMVEGPAGRIRINETDLEKYESRGYKLAKTKPADEKPADEKPAETEEVETKPADIPARLEVLSKMNMTDLKELGKKLEVEKVSTLAKTELVDAIMAIEFKPKEE